MSRVVVCYDIASDQRRRKVAECLEAYGDRVQESVFEAVLDARLLDRCISELAGLIEPGEDSVAAYALCAGCEGRRVNLGLAEGRNIGGEKVFIA